MNCKLLVSELLCAALLLGCSSAPKLTLPSGDWEEVSQPGAIPPLSAASPSTPSPYPTPSPAVTVSTPRAPMVFGGPPVKPGAPIAPAPSVPLPVPAAAPVTSPKPSVAAVAPVVAKSSVPGPVAPPSKVEGPTVAPPKAFPAPPAPPVAAVSAARPVPGPAPAPVRPVTPLPTWTAAVGSTLHQTVAEWCKRAGVRLIWNPEDLDYPIEAALSFRGTFPDAIDQIFPLYDNAKRSFLVDGNTSSQGILYVSERKK